MLTLTDGADSEMQLGFVRNGMAKASYFNGTMVIGARIDTISWIILALRCRRILATLASTRFGRSVFPEPTTPDLLS